MAYSNSNTMPNFKKVSPSARFRQVPPPLRCIWGCCHVTIRGLEIMKSGKQASEFLTIEIYHAMFIQCWRGEVSKQSPYVL